LIVEDDAGIATGLAATLKASGYAVDVTSTLALASAALRVEPFDLVLLDLNLPDGDGLDWLRQVRRSGSVMPVLIMTARDALPDRVAGLDEGADDYVVKPFEPEELLALLRGSGQVLSRQRLEQALYGFDEVLDSNALEVHMHHLRRKLGDGLVKTVRGVGYFVPVPENKGAV
jgi:DNA-binding response OmpR family regulator